MLMNLNIKIITVRVQNQIYFTQELFLLLRVYLSTDYINSSNWRLCWKVVPGITERRKMEV